MVTRECSKIVQARACEGLLRIRCRRNRSVALQDLCLAPTRILEGELTVLSVRFCDKVSEGQPESTLPERVTDPHCTCIRTSSHLEGSRLMTKKRLSVAVRRASRTLSMARTLIARAARKSSWNPRHTRHSFSAP